MDNTRVYNLDCMEGMKEFPDKYFELAICDPPYGINITKQDWNNHLNHWDSIPPNIEYFNELRRVSVNQIIWGVNNFDGFNLSGGRIVWNKLGKDIGRRNTAERFSECEIAFCSLHKTIKMFSYTYIGNVQGNDYQILWGDTNRIHPSQKPVALYKWLLKNYAKEGDKILDTHLGSQSSRIAAFDMGFDFTGYELDKDYFDAGNKRFEQHKSQLKLFV